MTLDLVPLPADTDVLDATTDPGAFVIASLGRAKAWLEQAKVTDLEAVTDAKAKAEAIRCYVAQKELGHDAELCATEIVRRAERRIGELVREGQADGVIRKEREGGGSRRPLGEEVTQRPEAVPDGTFRNTYERRDIYDMTDEVTGDEFEDAIRAGRAENNLSRANVVRKIRDKKRGDIIDGTEGRKPRSVRVEQITRLAAEAYTSAQIASELGITVRHVWQIAKEEGLSIHADDVTRKRRAIDSNRVVAETVDALDGLVIGLGLVDLADLDPERVEQWASSLRSSLRSINRFTKELTQ